jgi:hypothetical protein
MGHGTHSIGEVDEPLMGTLRETILARLKEKSRESFVKMSKAVMFRHGPSLWDSSAYITSTHTSALPSQQQPVMQHCAGLCYYPVKKHQSA